MQSFRARQGFSLLELMTVVAIAGFISIWGIASLRSYSKHEDTRRAASSVAGWLSKARSEAMAGGRMTFVVFAQPTNGTVPFDPGQYGAMVIDEDGDGQISAGDAITPLFLPNGINTDVTIYGVEGQTKLKNTPIPSDDESQAVVAGNMTNLTDGTTAPIDPTLGVPVIAYSPQGSPVAMATPTNWGTGAGGIYLTDNNDMLIAVVVLPLGDVHTLAWDTGSESWK